MTRERCGVSIQDERWQDSTLPAARFHRGPGLAVDFVPSDRLALVVRLLALDEPEGHLHPAVLVIQLKRHEREPFFRDLSRELPDLVAVQEELALTLLLVVRVAGVAVRTD